MGSTIPWAGGPGLYVETSQAWVYEQTLPVPGLHSFPWCGLLFFSAASNFCSLLGHLQQYVNALY